MSCTRKGVRAHTRIHACAQKTKAGLDSQDGDVTGWRFTTPKPGGWGYGNTLSEAGDREGHSMTRAIRQHGGILGCRLQSARSHRGDLGTAGVRFLHVRTAAFMGHVAATFFFCLALRHPRHGTRCQRRRKHDCCHQQIGQFATLCHANSLTDGRGPAYVI